MTKALTNGATLSRQDETELAKLWEIAEDLGRIPGRPTLIDRMGITDNRARQLIALARDISPQMPLAPHHTTTSGHQPPGHPRPLQVVPPPPGATHPDLAPPVDGQHPAASTAGADESSPASLVAPGDHPNPTWRHDATTPTTSATTSHHQHNETPKAAWALYVMAGVSLAPSLDTSWRFFGEKLGIIGWERIAMFAVLEIMLVLSAISMSANAKDTGRPGPARILVWAACGASAYMALLLAGPLVGWVRIALGPIMGLLALHFALGIQIRARKGAASTTWARIGRELRERMLSRLGLADDERDARTRTQDRAALRAAKLTLGTIVLFRAARVARLLRIAGVAHNPAIRNRMLAELAVLRHANDLAKLQQPSPWLTHDNPPAELA